MKLSKKVLEEVLRDTMLYRVRELSKSHLRSGYMFGGLNREEYELFDKLTEVTELPDYVLTSRNNQEIADSLIKVPCKNIEAFLEPSNLKKEDKKYNIQGMIMFDNIKHFPRNEDEISFIEKDLDQDNNHEDKYCHLRGIDPELVKELGRGSKILGKPFYWCLVTHIPNKESIHYTNNPYCIKYTLPCGHDFYKISVDNSDLKRTEKEIVDTGVSNILDTTEIHTYNSQGEIVRTDIVD
jgi:hypothetical protein